MLGLFYPAVLGAIAYYALEAIFGSLTPFIVARRFPTPAQIDFAKAYRALLYVLTFTFYCCDYFYLRFTNTYRRLFFVFDVVFIVGLYITATLIETRDSSGIPDLRAITTCFFIFMVLYLVWDCTEYKEALRQNLADRTVYGWVIGWECVSLLLLALALAVAERTVWRAVAVAVILLLIDLGFMFIDGKKKGHCRSLPT